MALECLGRTSDPELVKFVLSFAFAKDVKDQDVSQPRTTDKRVNELLVVLPTMACWFVLPWGYRPMGMGKGELGTG